MPKYVMWGSYCEDVLEKRAPHRQAHLDGLAAQKESGILITIGPTKDVTKVFGIYEAENEATVRQLLEADPYWQNGIWTEYDVKEWIQAFKSKLEGRVYLAKEESDRLRLTLL
jgi:uncharacterized protein YciI